MKEILKSTVKAKYVIGIDPGVNTGFAVWNRERKEFVVITCDKIHEIMVMVKLFQQNLGTENIFIRLEDARLRTWFGNSGRGQLQGAGSIKRDCGIWQDFLEDLGLQYELVPPKKNRTKVSAEWFKATTKYTGRTNNHARDAAMLVFNY